MASPPAQLRPGDALGRDILVTRFELENEETFHLKNLYKLIWEWMGDEGFVAVDSKDDKIEALYLDRSFANGNKEHRIWWRGVQVPRDNKYYRYFLKIDWVVLNMKKIEIMHKGQKFSTNKGDVVLFIEAWLQLDYQNKWQKNPILKFFDRWFRERFYLENIKAYKHDLYLTAFRLNNTIKQYLQLKSPADWGRPFHPERGV